LSRISSSAASRFTQPARSRNETAHFLPAYSTIATLLVLTSIRLFVRCRAVFQHPVNQTLPACLFLILPALGYKLHQSREVSDSEAEPIPTSHQIASPAVPPINLTDQLRHNLQAVLSDVKSACDRVSRPPASVKLIAVTKYAPWEAVLALSQLHRTFGESRPQQLAERATQLPDVEWHLIGQLQRNKVGLAVEHAAAIHSVDSLRLLQRIDKVASDRGVSPRLLLQVNISHEDAKSGFSPNELISTWPRIVDATESTSIVGLMAMAAATDDAEQARPAFRELRQLRDVVAATSESRDRGWQLTELSMGMSGDFVPAIEEGATLIRVGSRMIEGVDSFT
jgi:pyridoxal phosphate enzyme (YggS family)